MFNSIQEEIQALKKLKGARVFAHYYQRAEIKEVADFIGDSLQLAVEAKKANCEMIVLAGVYFMGETAKILNPKTKVLVPDVAAGCSLSDSCEVDEFVRWREAHPDHVAVSYVNCSAAVKAHSDIICTSANALKVIESIPQDQAILFAPDRNLGAYLKSVTGRNLVLWPGACTVHEVFAIEKIVELRKKFPNALLIVHPESDALLIRMADFVGSTSAMIRYVASSDHSEFIIATEVGILDQLREVAGNKLLIPAPSQEENACACSECAFMKVNTLEKLRDALKFEIPEVVIEEDIRAEAEKSLIKMMNL